MVGDGINDAAALAQADAGIAMGTGADLAQEAGDVLLLRTQPSAIPAALGLARQTLRIMRQNLGWAVGYNLLGHSAGRGAALSGLSHPAHALAGRGRHGAQLGVRAGQQLAAAALVEFTGRKIATAAPRFTRWHSGKLN